MDSSVKPIRTFEENPHPAEKYAGTYQFVDLEPRPDAKLTPGELNKYKKCNIFEIVVNGNEIFFSDLGHPFDYKGTLVLNEPHMSTYDSNDQVTTCVKLWNDDTLRVEKTHEFDGIVLDHIMRFHKLVAAGDKVHLITSDNAVKLEPGGKFFMIQEPRLSKTYVRVPNLKNPITNTNNIDIPSMM